MLFAASSSAGCTEPALDRRPIPQPPAAVAGHLTPIAARICLAGMLTGTCTVGAAMEDVETVFFCAFSLDRRAEHVVADRALVGVKRYVLVRSITRVGMRV